MTRKNHWIVILVIAGILFSCSDSMKKPLKEISTHQEIVIAEDTLVLELEVIQFSIENWSSYPDSIGHYFSEGVGWYSDSLEWTIDTSEVDNYTLFDYNNGILQIEVYDFKSSEEATDYFNELKSREFLI
ncbi:MAG: hypothetical protein HRT57_09590 [Crocinitomicaceae bacterium]|nr:hypothetical protein [Crocinitomicaceae bacterium]